MWYLVSYNGDNKSIVTLTAKFNDKLHIKDDMTGEELDIRYGDINEYAPWGCSDWDGAQVLYMPTARELTNKDVLVLDYEYDIPDVYDVASLENGSVYEYQSDVLLINEMHWSAKCLDYRGNGVFRYNTLIYTGLDLLHTFDKQLGGGVVVKYNKVYIMTVERYCSITFDKSRLASYFGKKAMMR